ncbi:hypothetical protein YC2023_100194 [Brassica napus]
MMDGIEGLSGRERKTSKPSRCENRCRDQPPPESLSRTRRCPQTAILLMDPSSSSSSASPHRHTPPTSSLPPPPHTDQKPYKTPLAFTNREKQPATLEEAHRDLSSTEPDMHERKVTTTAWTKQRRLGNSRSATSTSPARFKDRR